MEILVLGPIAVRVDGREVPIGGPRQRRLLAALVRAEGRVVSTGQLADAVWADEADPPAAAERTLQSYVSRLRTALGEGHVIGEAGGYRLGLCEGAVDAHRFGALIAEASSAPPETALGLLDEALALWRGPAYAEFAHEDWVRPVAAGLEELRLVALERRAQARLDLGQHAEVVPELEVLAREHPLRERFEAQLMLALHRSGRQGDALRSFRRHRSTLAEETGLVPSRELVDLERRIALDDPSLAFVAAGRVARGYVLADEIGAGSFGTVYRAVQPSVGREVAVKVVQAGARRRSGVRPAVRDRGPPGGAPRAPAHRAAVRLLAGAGWRLSSSSATCAVARRRVATPDHGRSPRSTGWPPKSVPPSASPTRQG